MKIDEMRQITIGAIRSELRHIGIDPCYATALEIESVLDSMSRSNPDLIASQWYKKASKRQWCLFKRDWKKHFKLTAAAKREINGDMWRCANEGRSVN